jgi:hypothetical protein
MRIVRKITTRFDRFTEPPSRHRKSGRWQPGTPAEEMRWQVNMFRQSGENMNGLKKEVGLKEIGGKPEVPGKSPKAKFVVFGQEMIEKEIKQCGKNGRVYLPPDWVGRQVKIIRID